MYFGKIPHPANFDFCSAFGKETGFAAPGGPSYPTRLEAIGGNAFRLRIETGDAAHYANLADYAENIGGEGGFAAEIVADGAFRLSDSCGAVLLSGKSGAMFGRCGRAWMLQFAHTPDMQFFGLGEHCRGFEKTGKRVKFWNTDVWADYPMREVIHGEPESLYASIPWLIVKRGNTYAGILVRHPGAVWMDLASNFVWDGRNADDTVRQSFYIGAPDGSPDVYILAGPTLPELTRRMQALVGKTPLPPLWALGHHQCRWGYASPEDLRELDRKYEEHGIPTDGLWLDIDYMDRYKVFSFDPKLWGDGDGVKAVCAELKAKGRRVVPILDPGVKADSAYPVCAEGLERNLFCHAPSGRPFTGFVWPGKTFLPDFSLPQARAWWTEKVREFAEKGPSGAWLDMNDPSVGATELSDMLFQHGKEPHEYGHNEYALGMAMASREGFLAARPEERPFLLSRSASPGMSRYAAVWTGDNYSNRHHLKKAIPVSLNLALSGIPFNGPDVPGFGGDATPELAVSWYKCGFLFPFLRNHSISDSRRKEPWQFGPEALEVIGHYIRLRYKLLPYLYNLWIAQEESGEAVMRPLIYDFADTPELPLISVDDEFMTGPAILSAPILEDGAASREVTLPAIPDGGRWFSAIDGSWHESGVRKECAAGFAETPLFIREGTLLPLLPGVRKSQKSDLALVELHAFLRRDTKGVFQSAYAFDDGISYGYRQGSRTKAEFETFVEDNRALVVRVITLSEGCRPLTFRVATCEAFDAIRIEHKGRVRDCVPEEASVQLTGDKLRTYVSSAWNATMVAGRRQQ
ncbi:MAG TPA: glycoside hydrolase family 31 protein [Opitutales bacterium]|nr:glycoside hydrolase family 31 protein [Opitutales bacterium]